MTKNCKNCKTTLKWWEIKHHKNWCYDCKRQQFLQTCANNCGWVFKTKQTESRACDVCRIKIAELAARPCWKCGSRPTATNPTTKKPVCFDCYFNVKTDENGTDYMNLKIEKIVS